MKVSENTSVSMPIKNMIGIIVAVSLGIFAFTEITARLTSLETSRELMNALTTLRKAVENVESQHMNEAFSGITNVGAGYSNKEAQKFSVDAVNKAGKEIGKAQQRAVSIFTSDLKNKKYDNMDLIRSIKTGNIRDTSFSKRNVLQQLYFDVRDRFNKYNRRKKN